MTRSDGELEVRALDHNASIALSTIPLEGIADEALGSTLTRNVSAMRDVERNVSVPIAEVSTTVDPAAAHDSVTSTTHGADGGHDAIDRRHDVDDDESADISEPDEVCVAPDNSTVDHTTADVTSATASHDSADVV